MPPRPRRKEFSLFSVVVLMTLAGLAGPDFIRALTSVRFGH